jgi:hypothetical protein
MNVTPSSRLVSAMVPALRHLKNGACNLAGGRAPAWPAESLEKFIARRSRVPSSSQSHAFCPEKMALRLPASPHAPVTPRRHFLAGSRLAAAQKILGGSLRFASVPFGIFDPLRRFDGVCQRVKFRSPMMKTVAPRLRWIRDFTGTGFMGGHIALERLGSMSRVVLLALNQGSVTVGNESGKWKNAFSFEM